MIDEHRHETSRLHAAAVWLLLLAVVAGYAVLHRVRPPEREDGDARDAGSPQLLVLARYAVGVQGWMALGNAAGGPDARLALLTQLRDAAKTPRDRLRLAPVTAELADAKAAAAELAALAAEPATPPDLRRDAGLLQRVYVPGSQTLDGADRDGLRARHAWFADLALSFGLPKENPARAAVLRPAKRTVVIIVGALMALLPAGLTGLGLLVIAAVAWAHGGLPARHGRIARDTPGSGIVFVEGVVVFLVTLLFVPALLGVLVPAARWVAYIVLPVPLAVLWIWSRDTPSSALFRGLGWHAGLGVVREAFCGVLGYVAGLPIVMAGGAVTILLVRWTGDRPTHPIAFEVLGADVWKWIGLLLLACVVAPVTEETIFRGALYHALRRRHAAGLSALVTGLLFAVVHPQGLFVVPLLAALGVVFALVREWRDSLIAPMAAHALNNFLAVGLMAALFT